MTAREAREQAEMMGMSAWQEEVIQVGVQSEAVPAYCVGFASIGVAISVEGTWEDALREATRIIYKA